MKNEQRQNNPIPTSARNYVWIAALATIVQFVLFKYFYPYPDFFGDSYTYIEAAMHRDTVSIRPIGYSVFLLLIHGISDSGMFLALIQYLLMQAACFYLFLTLLRFYRPSKIVQRILFVFLFLNPVSLYMCNYVSSDALFISLSLVWIVELIRMTFRQTWWRATLQLILLAMILGLRFTALYYPLIFVLAILLSGKNILFKSVAIAGCFIVIAIGITVARQETYRQTGVAMFSPFSAWQVANNALIAYTHIPAGEAGRPPQECRELDSMVRTYIDTTSPARRIKISSLGSQFMWEETSPLKRFTYSYMQKNNCSYFLAWNRVAPVFSKYGYFLIRQHPIAFTWYYLWPSARHFLLPPLEILWYYNEGKEEISPVAKDWFGLDSTHVKVRYPNIQRWILYPLTWLNFFVNLFFVLTTILFLLAKDLRHRAPAFFRSYLLVGAYFVANACFSIFAAPNELRYQLLPLILLFSFSLACIPFLFARRSSSSAVASA